MAATTRFRSSDFVVNFRSVLFARTDCASPVVRDQTDSRAHGDRLQKSLAFHPPPLAIVLKYARCPTSIRLDGFADVTSLSCCFPSVSMKATVSKNGYRHRIAGASFESRSLSFAGPASSG